jgi:hypothetical protein
MQAELRLPDLEGHLRQALVTPEKLNVYHLGSGLALGEIAAIDDPVADGLVNLDGTEHASRGGWEAELDEAPRILRQEVLERAIVGLKRHGRTLAQRLRKCQAQGLTFYVLQYSPSGIQAIRLPHRLGSNCKRRSGRSMVVGS